MKKLSRKDGDIKVGIHSIITDRYLFYIAVTPTIPVTINRIIECSALINTGDELNVIITDVTDKAGLNIRTRVKIKMTLYLKYINRFLGMVENILISVGLVFCRVNIFVTRSAP